MEHFLPLLCQRIKCKSEKERQRSQRQQQKAEHFISFAHHRMTDIKNATNRIDEEEIGAVPHSSTPMSVKACETEMCENDASHSLRRSFLWDCLWRLQYHARGARVLWVVIFFDTHKKRYVAPRTHTIHKSMSIFR